ncbi:MAG TPA: cysteine desulfurase NifS [Clostridia bacterium]|nr:cysteine desulfurase NifS [Clostridia bacterium]
MRMVYLDNSATTPIDLAVFEEMKQYLTDKFGNPSSVHTVGRKIRADLERAREQVANAIGAEPREIFFTSGGTEADNIAVKGTAYANRSKGDHIITSSIEHPAVLEACKQLEKEGFQLTILPVDDKGLVSVEKLRKAITDRTILISIMHANNEVGTVQPVEEIGELASERGIVFHTDAVQSVGKIGVNVKTLNAGLLSLSAHKIYGPKGVGALYVRRGVRPDSLITGGSQEKGLRPGTENVAGIVALGKAVELAVANLDKEMARLGGLRKKLKEGIEKGIADVSFNGHSVNKVPNILNYSFKYIEGEALLLGLDLKGIAVSSGSACSSSSMKPSSVLLAMGVSPEMARSSLRISLGKYNTEEDVDYFLTSLREVVERLREMSPLASNQ